MTAKTIDKSHLSKIGAQASHLGGRVVMGTSDSGAEIAVDVIDDGSSFIRSGLYSENEIGMLEVSVKGNPSVINKHEFNSESKFMKERDDTEGGSLKRDGLKERAAKHKRMIDVAYGEKHPMEGRDACIVGDKEVKLKTYAIDFLFFNSSSC